jgi:hypothetical protein
MCVRVCVYVCVSSYAGQVADGPLSYCAHFDSFAAQMFGRPLGMGVCSIIGSCNMSSNKEKVI